MFRNLFVVMGMIFFDLAWGGEEVIKVRLGYVTKVACEGRLYISAIGNESLVGIEALPKELGCAVMLKPMGRSGMTNLILETSLGTVLRDVRVIGP